MSKLIKIVSMAKLADMDQIDRESVREFFRRIGTGFKVWPREKRELIGRITAGKGWALRRKLYGPTGRKAVDVRLRRKLEAVGWECKESPKASESLTDCENGSKSLD